VNKAYVIDQNMFSFVPRGILYKVCVSRAGCGSKVGVKTRFFLFLDIYHEVFATRRVVVSGGGRKVVVSGGGRKVVCQVEGERWCVRWMEEGGVSGEGGRWCVR